MTPSAELADLLAHPRVRFMDLPCGFLRDVEAATYHEKILGVASSGGLGKVLRAPSVYRAWVGGEDEEPEEETPLSKALAFGSLAHCFTLEPSVFERTYMVLPDFGDMRSSTNRAKRDAWKAERPGVEFVSEKDLVIARGIRAELVANTEIGPYVRRLWAGDPNVIAEATCKWICPHTGLVCRVRPDLVVCDDFECEVFDFKTCVNATADGFNKSRSTYGYHRQEAFYREGLDAVGSPVRRFRFFAAEKTRPFLSKAYELDREVLALGERQVEEAKDTLARCLELDDWPGLSTGTETLGLLPWERRR